MIKILTMFERDESVKGHPVIDKVRPGCEWVARGEGFATRKMDGTNVMVKDGKLYKRQKPKDGVYTEASYVEVDMEAKENVWIVGAYRNWPIGIPADGIYEAIGPNIQGNPENLISHCLISVLPINAELIITEIPRDFDGLRECLRPWDIEGIVFRNWDGRMAKIKKKDFGLPRRSQI